MKRRSFAARSLAAIAAAEFSNVGLLHAAGAAHSAARDGHLEDGVAPTEVRIEAVFDMSGPISGQCRIGFAGAQIYLDRMNASGGIHGRQVQLKFRDDGFDPARTAEIVRSVAETKSALAIFGVVGDQQAAAALTICDEYRMPLFAPVSGAPALRSTASKYVYFLRCSYRTEALRIFEHASTLGHRKLAIAFNNDGFGEAMRAEIATIRVGDARVTESLATGQSEPALLAGIAGLRERGVTAIVVAAVGGAFTTFVKASRKAAGSSLQVYGFSLITPQEIFRDLGPMGRGVVLSQCVPSLSSTTMSVVNEYKSAHGAANLSFPPNAFTFEGFLMAKVFSEALRRAGRDLQRNGLLAALDSMNSFDTGGFRVSPGFRSRSGSTFADLAVVDAEGRLRF